MKTLVKSIVLATLATNAVAMDLPQPNIKSTFDKIRTSTGAECQTSLDTGRYLSAGTYAKQDDVGLYISLNFKLGMDKVKSVKDCTQWVTLQEQRDSAEIQKLQAELELMKMQAEMLAKQTAGAQPDAAEDW